MAVVSNLVGKKFGKLTVIERSANCSKGRTNWSCVCECGKEKNVSGTNLSTGNSTSCGCAKYDRPIQYLTDKTYGRLTVKEFLGRDPRFPKHTLWACVCECGTATTVRANNLLKTKSPIRSCGCIGNEKAKARTGDNNTNWTGGVLAHHVRRYHTKATKRGLVWELSTDACLKLFNSNCHYCAQAPENYAQDAIRVGIDRVDNSKGYTPDNVVSCCYTCNLMKHALPEKVFLDHVEKIYINLRR